MSRLAALCGLALSALGASVVAADPPEPGTRGVLRTVVTGAEPVEIPVEFVGTLDDAIGPGYPLYLVRLEGELAARVGVAAGMSGSPVYVDEEIVGALSYRIGVFPAEPIAGVTPVETMREAGRATVTIADERVRPIGTPLVVSGAAPEVSRWLETSLSGRGVQLLTGSRSSSSGDGAALEPGDAVGVELVRGALGIAATGTVTWIDGDRVYAFGHPFLGSGAVEYPMVRAEVVHTLADRLGSFKMARIGAPVGVIEEDRLTAVVGRLGRELELLPVEVAFRDVDGRETRQRAEVVRERSLVPLLIAATVANAGFLHPSFEQRLTAEATGEIRLAGRPGIPFRWVASSAQGPHPYFAISTALQLLVQRLVDNPFGAVRLDAVRLEIAVREEERLFEMTTVRYDRRPVSAGEKIPIQAVLSARREDGERVVPLTVTIPAGTAPGTRLAVAVGSPTQVERALGGPDRAGLGSARDLDGYLAVLRRGRPADRVIAVLYREGAGAASGGTVHLGLPPSAAALLASPAGGRGARSVGAEVLDRDEVPVDGPLIGGFVVRFETERPR